MILQGNLCIYRLFLPIRLAFCPFPAIISKSRQNRPHFTCSRQSGRPFFTILLYPEIIASAFVRSDNFSLQNRLCSMQGLYIPWFSLHQKRRGMSRLPDAMLPFRHDSGLPGRWFMQCRTTGTASDISFTRSILPII